MVRDITKLTFPARHAAESHSAARTGPNGRTTREQSLPDLLPDFLCGDENRLVGIATQYIQTVRSQLPAQRSLNPIYLYGDEGVGKSHLASGWLRVWNFDQGNPSGRLISAVTLTQGTSKRRILLQIRQALDESSLLIIEDVHQLRRKPNAQLRLTWMIDELIGQKRQLVLTGLSMPGGCPYYVPRLASRLCGGLFFEIRKPSLEVRKEWIRRYVQRRGLTFTRRALDRLALHLDGTVMQIRRSLEDMLPSMTSEHESIDLRELQPILSLKQERIEARYAELTIQAVARYFQIPINQLVGKSRRQATVRARGVAILLLRRWAKLSFNQIGFLLGRRDHSTIMHAYQRIETLMREDEELRGVVADLGSVIETKD